MNKTIMTNLNFVFWGTPDVASETLEILKQNGYVPSLIITSPDAKKGRGMHLESSPVAVFAEKNNIPCLKPEKLEDKEVGDILRTLGRSDGDGQRKFSAENFRGEQNIPDLFVVVAYGKIIPENIINIPKLGSINIHYSLLPKYRGASPVESAILNGDTETGITIQKMAFKMDSGPIIAQEKVEILANEKSPDLRKRLIKIGAELLIKTLPEFVAEKIKPIPQNGSLASVCKKIQKEDGLINLNDDAVKNYNKFRAYAYWPRTFFFSAKGGS
ncbi:MAG: methionyl-tRNA formyltransferase, partial [bacterium]